MWSGSWIVVLVKDNAYIFLVRHNSHYLPAFPLSPHTVRITLLKKNFKKNWGIYLARCPERDVAIQYIVCRGRKPYSYRKLVRTLLHVNYCVET